MLQALDNEPLKYQVLVHLALALGCRRGELVALRWQDIDLDTGVVSIGHSAYKLKGKAPALKDPKNRSSLRNITLPQYCIPLLRCYRIGQNEERMKLGTLWQDGDWVFTKWNGEQMNPDTPTG